jgi:hypothetical protein
MRESFALIGYKPDWRLILALMKNIRVLHLGTPVREKRLAALSKREVSVIWRYNCIFLQSKVIKNVL